MVLFISHFMIPPPLSNGCYNYSIIFAYFKIIESSWNRLCDACALFLWFPYTLRTLLMIFGDVKYTCVSVLQNYA